MTRSADMAAQDVWDDLDKGEFTEGVRVLLARHLQKAYDAGYRDGDVDDQVAFDKFVMSLKPGDKT